MFFIDPCLNNYERYLPVMMLQVVEGLDPVEQQLAQMEGQVLTHNQVCGTPFMANNYNFLERTFFYFRVLMIMSGFFFLKILTSVFYRHH